MIDIDDIEYIAVKRKSTRLSVLASVAVAVGVVAAGLFLYAWWVSNVGFGSGQ